MEEYVQHKSLNGIWGDNIEIQAMSEIYDRPIEIYAYDTKPMNIFHDQSHDDE